MFPGNTPEEGAAMSLRKVPTTGSMSERQALAFPENSEVSCVSQAFPGRANCASKGEVWRRGLFKGMMLPAVCSDRVSAWILIKSVKGGRQAQEGGMTIGAHPFINVFRALFPMISLFISLENEARPRAWHANGTRYLHLLPKAKCPGSFPSV